MFYIMFDRTRVVGIGNEKAETVLMFTEHTSQEVGESVCRFLNGIESREDLYLMIVRHHPDTNAWVIDEDSRHHLEEDSHTVFELQVATIRPLVRAAACCL